MGRTRSKLDVHGEAEEVLCLLANEPAGWRRERLLALKMGLEGEKSYQEICTVLGRSLESIRKWFDAFRKGGVAGLLFRGRGQTGPKSRLSEAAKSELLTGLKEGRWRSAVQIRTWLKQTHGIEVAQSSVYKYLGKVQARLRVPRPVHIKKDPAAAEAFKNSLADKLEALEISKDRPVRLWVMDEMRCGLHTEVRRLWTTRGNRVVVPVQQKYQWNYVFGALGVGHGGAEFLYSDTVNLECNQLFLEQIAARDPRSIHVVIYDGAGFHHRDGAADVPDNVRIVVLPAYSPELNPVEKLWDVVRDGICNQVFGTIEALQKAQTAVLEKYWGEARGVYSLIGGGWILSQANVFSGNDFAILTK